MNLNVHPVNGAYQPTNGCPAPVDVSRSSGLLRPRPQTVGINSDPVLTFLVLDDDPVFAGMLGEMIVFLGNQVVICHHPIEALEQVSRRDFDLILCDYRLPEMDGCQFYTRVIGTKPTLAFRFLFVTGEVGNTPALEFMVGVGLGCLIKPITLSGLESEINRALSQAKIRSGRPHLPAPRPPAP